MENKNLPQLKDLVNDLDVYQKRDDLSFLLNQDPPEKWIKIHPYVKNHKYIPIDKVEYLLRSIFKEYSIKILREGTSFNGVYVVVRVKYRDLITGKMNSHDGIGAIHLQVKSGSSPADLSNINNGALSMAYPLAETLAIKDACDKIGRIFGADLNRKDLLPTTYNTKILNPEQKVEKINTLLNIDGLIITEEDRLNIERILEQKEEASYDKVIKMLTLKIPK